MRRRTSFLATLTLAATTVAIPSTAHADAKVVSLTTQFDKLSADRVATVTLKATSPSGITNVTADVSDIADPGGWVPFTTLRFTRVDGTDNDGTWQAEFRTDIENHPGHNRIAVQITSADGATLMRPTGLTNCYTASIADLQSSPSVIDIDHSTITVRGRVLRQKQQGAPLEPMAGVTVNGTDGARTQTAANGSFTHTSSGHTSALASVPMQGTLCAVGRWAPSPTVAKQPMTTTARLITPQPVLKGTRVQVRGQVVRQGTNGPVPAADVFFQIVRNHGSAGEERLADGQTAADGMINAEFPAGGSGALTIVLAETPWLLATNADVGALDVRQPTKITNFSAGPEPLPYGGPLDAGGLLLNADDSPITDAPIVLEYSADGKTGWRTMGTATTNGSGQFILRPRRITRDGYWRARFAGNATHAPAVTWVDHIDVKYRTEFYSFNASPEPVKKGRTITVKGSLDRFMDEPLAARGATVYIYFRATGSTTWKQMAVTRTGSDGWFEKKFTASQDGTWMATYKGSATYIKSSTPGDYVDVR